jgi:hypothetical protein
MAMKKEEARRAVLTEYDGWAKKHPDAANIMGGFLFFRYLQQERSATAEQRLGRNPRERSVSRCGKASTAL